MFGPTLDVLIPMAKICVSQGVKTTDVYPELGALMTKYNELAAGGDKDETAIDTALNEYARSPEYLGILAAEQERVRRRLTLM